MLKKEAPENVHVFWYPSIWNACEDEKEEFITHERTSRPSSIIILRNKYYKLKSRERKIGLL